MKKLFILILSIFFMGALACGPGLKTEGSEEEEKRAKAKEEEEAKSKDQEQSDAEKKAKQDAAAEQKKKEEEQKKAEEGDKEGDGQSGGKDKSGGFSISGSAKDLLNKAHEALNTSVMLSAGEGLAEGKESATVVLSGDGFRITLTISFSSTNATGEGAEITKAEATFDDGESYQLKSGSLSLKGYEKGSLMSGEFNVTLSSDNGGDEIEIKNGSFSTGALFDNTFCK